MPQPSKLPIKARRFGAQPLAALVLPCMDAVLAKQGFSETDVLMHWPEIVGSTLASHCRPIKLQWRPRIAGSDSSLEPATLLIRVEGSFAIMLQHMAPVVLEKVNGHLGWRCVGKIALRQGPLPLLPRREPSLRAVDPEARRQAATLAASVIDDDLRRALVRLGSRVLDTRKSS